MTSLPLGASTLKVDPCEAERLSPSRSSRPEDYIRHVLGYGYLKRQSGCGVPFAREYDLPQLLGSRSE